MKRNQAELSIVSSFSFAYKLTKIVPESVKKLENVLEFLENLLVIICN